MDFIKQQFDRIHQQLATLNATQKMLAGTLMVIMVMTLLWWGRYAGQTEMEPVLDQTLAAEEIRQITSRLSAKRIPYRVAGDRVLVPVHRKFEVLAELGYAQLLPRDTKTGFDEIAKQMSPWDPHTKTAALLNQAKQVSLAQVVRNFPGVSNAMVIIDPTRERLVGGALQPTATVNITMQRGHSASRHLVEAAAHVVEGAQAGLDRGRIRVVVDGVSYPLPDRDGGGLLGGNEFLELTQHHERHYANKIRDQLSFIPGVLVSVTVDVNTRSSQQQSRRVDPKEFIHKEREIFSRTEEDSTPGSAGIEPGALPNMGLAIPDAVAGEGASSLVDENKTTFTLLHSETIETSRMPAGSAAVTAATVRVPRSHFIRIYRQGNPAATEDPDDALLRPLIDDRLRKIRNDVKACTGLWSDDAVIVETYTDMMPATALLPQAAGSAVPLAITQYAREIAIGALAVISLLMVSMMVRKGGGAPPVPAPVRVDSGPAPQLPTGDDLAGEAGEGRTLLDGMELDEDAVRTQQMLEQVTTLVKDNPEAAANLVKRWMNRS